MFLEMNFRSKELNCNTQVNVILPDRRSGTEAPYKTLWLLHGLKGDHTSWMRSTCIERYANRYGIAVVMPSVQRSWYTDTAYEANYFSFVTKELYEVCHASFRGMSEAREDNIVGGLSMGGYGAVKAALRCPDRYGACISLSGSFDITRKGRPLSLNEWRGIFDFEMQTPLELENSEHDLFALAAKNHENGTPFPKLYLWCGTEDPLMEVNDAFHRHLAAFGVEHRFDRSTGTHAWKWWDKHIQSALKYILEEDAETEVPQNSTDSN